MNGHRQRLKLDWKTKSGAVEDYSGEEDDSTVDNPRSTQATTCEHKDLNNSGLLEEGHVTDFCSSCKRWRKGLSHRHVTSVQSLLQLIIHGWKKKWEKRKRKGRGKKEKNK